MWENHRASTGGLNNSFPPNTFIGVVKWWKILCLCSVCKKCNMHVVETTNTTGKIHVNCFVHSIPLVFRVKSQQNHRNRISARIKVLELGFFFRNLEFRQGVRVPPLSNALIHEKTLSGACAGLRECVGATGAWRWGWLWVVCFSVEPPLCLLFSARTIVCSRNLALFVGICCRRKRYLNFFMDDGLTMRDWSVCVREQKKMPKWKFNLTLFACEKERRNHVENIEIWILMKSALGIVGLFESVYRTQHEKDMTSRTSNLVNL